jgi:hypothetical protein
MDRRTKSGIVQPLPYRAPFLEADSLVIPCGIGAAFEIEKQRERVCPGSRQPATAPKHMKHVECDDSENSQRCAGMCRKEERQM